MKHLLSLVLLAALAVPVHAQHHADHADASADVPSGLTAAERDGLLAGTGLGLAAPADRNGYPGPMHVLQFADSLALTDRQRSEAERLRADVLAAAVPLGAEIVAAETRLNALFASGRATPADIGRQSVEVAALRGRLRAVHLAAHVGMRGALTTDQIATYTRLRSRP